MKVANRQITSFIAKDWQNYAIIVLFGHAPDVMRRRQLQIIDHSGVDPHDAFAFLRLEGARVAQDESLLFHEAFSSSLTMEPRMIVVSGKTAELSKAVIRLCEQESYRRLGNNRLLVTIEDLTTKSALLKHLASCSWAAAVPCYTADTHELVIATEEFSRRHACTFDAEAEATLLHIAENNWEYLTQILEKLSLYLEKNSTIHVEDVIACSDRGQQYQLLDFALCAFMGNAEITDRWILNLIQQKVTIIAIVRQLIQHCLKLLRLKSGAESKDIDQAISAYKPPIFFRQIPALTQQCQRFSASQLQQHLRELLELEMRAKTHPVDEEAFLRQWLLRLKQPSR